MKHTNGKVETIDPQAWRKYQKLEQIGFGSYFSSTDPDDHEGNGVVGDSKDISYPACDQYYSYYPDENYYWFVYDSGDPASSMVRSAAEVKVYRGPEHNWTIEAVIIRDQM